MRHLYECPMRWADLDMLGHVNNVVYVDYLQEARVDLMRTILPARDGSGARLGEGLTEGVVVVRHEVTSVAPLLLRPEPIRIDVWVTRIRAATFTLAYEVYDELPDARGEGTGRRVYLRATTVLTPYVFAEERPRRITPEERAALEAYLDEAPRPPTDRIGGVAVGTPGARDYPLQVRFSDVDLYRHVNNVKYFEYFQEARVQLFAALTARLAERPDVPGMRIVIAQTDVDYLAPILLRAEPYVVTSAVTRVGRRSLAVEATIHDTLGGRDVALARARVVAVFFDLDTQASADPHPAYVELFERAATAPSVPSRR